MPDLIAIIIVALVLPVLLAVAAAQFLIRRNNVGAGLLSGLGIILMVLVFSLVLINYDIDQCTLRCQQTYGIEPAPCRFSCVQEGQGSNGGYTIIGAIIDTNAFLLCGLSLARFYKQPVSLSNAFLLYSGMVAVIAGITILGIRSYSETDHIIESPQTYLSSFTIGLSGILVVIAATYRMRQSRNASQ